MSDTSSSNIPRKEIILFKFATRSRPQKFFDGLDNILSNLEDKENYLILVSADEDDPAMYNKQVFARLKEYVNKYNVLISYSQSRNKVDAINRDINELSQPWDILVNFSDDMKFIVNGFDEIIRQELRRAFPDLNGNIHFNDGFTKDKVCTMSIMGRRYYDQFKYVYHPDYISLWCDNEYTEVAMANRRMMYINDPIYHHMHPNNVGGFIDEQYQNTEKYYYIDGATYEKRKLANFPKKSILEQAQQ